MQRSSHVFGFASGLAGMLLLASPSVAEPAAPGIVVTAPWLRATPKNAPVAGGYATITNKGATPDVLLGASLPMAAKG